MAAQGSDHYEKLVHIDRLLEKDRAAIEAALVEIAGQRQSHIPFRPSLNDSPKRP